jgi:hypothetical protein
VIDKCAPYDISIDRNDIIGLLYLETEPLQHLNNSVISAILSDIDKHLPKVPQKKLSKIYIAAKSNLNVPSKYKQKYKDVFYQHQKAISINKYHLGLAKNFAHKIHHKDNNPVYRKQCKTPEAHLNIIEQLLEEWLKLGIVKCCNSLYNSPILCVPNRQGKGLRVV